jgi:hypothetical protein
MGEILAILMIFTLSSWSISATYYVNPSQYDNSGDGSLSSPKKTIMGTTGAWSQCVDGDVIKLVPGQYDAITQGVGWTIEVNAQNTPKTITIESDTDQVTLQTANNYGVVYIAADGPSKKLTLRNIKFSPPFANRWFHEANNCQMNLTFDNCIFDYTARDIPLTDGFGTYSGVLSREIVVTKCIYQSSVPWPVKARYMKKLIFTECNLTFTNNDSNSMCIYPLNFVGLILFKGCVIDTKCTFYNSDSSFYDVDDFAFDSNRLTHSALSKSGDYSIIIPDKPTNGVRITNNYFTCTVAGGSRVWHPILMGALSRNSVNYLYSPVITGNTLITSLPGYVGEAIKLGYTVRDVAILNNMIVGFQHGIMGFQEQSVIENNVIKCSNPLYLNGVRYSLIKNNTSYAVSGVPDPDGRAIVFGRKEWTNVTSNHTTFTANSVADSFMWDVSKTNTEMVCIVTSAPGDLAPVYYGVVQYGGTNSVFVDQWIRVSSGQAETPPDGMYAKVIQWSEHNTVLNNIFDAGNARYCITFDFNPRAGWNFIDYNCYVKGSHPWISFSNLGIYVNGQGGTANITEQRQRWSVFARVFIDNDLHSIEADPQFTNPSLNIFTLQPTSPCIRTGLPRVYDAMPTMGAWMPENETADLNHDGIIDVLDFVILSNQWLSTIN